MIIELHVENLAIIHQAQIQFRDGFTALTGGTGAGKSLLVDALELCLGERADTELVRTGSTKATVQLVVDLSRHSSLLQELSEFGIDHESGQIYIQREVLAEGRSQARINGKSVPVATLRELGTRIVDLHGQHQHQALLNPESHVEHLDSWIGQPATDLKGTVAETYAGWLEAKRKYDALKKGIQEREQRLDMLRFQVQEIEDFAPVEGEEAELTASLARLNNVEKISAAAQRALASLSESEANARDLLALGLKDAEEIARLDPSYEPVELTEALATLQEAIHDLQSYFEQLENDPEALENAIERIDGLKRLKRKYGQTEAEILSYLVTAKEELASLVDVEASEEALRANLETAEKHLRKACQDLTELRQSKSVAFCQDVREHLADLSMGKTLFEVSIAPGEPTPTGADVVEFLFSANAGEDLKPLAKIASGGEISRVMLAMKSAMAGRAGVPTLIFDEVDTGLGGAAAAAVGKKIRALADHYQVLAISHLPQVASQANDQFRIQKDEISGRVETSVVRLSEDERVREIARMLAGDEVGEHAVANAKAMLRLL